jgi:hypothetical protein
LINYKGFGSKIVTQYYLKCFLIKFGVLFVLPEHLYIATY